MCNHIQDGVTKDNLTKTQHTLLNWHHQLVHVDMKSIRYFPRTGCLPKEIANYATPLCPFCIQAKQEKYMTTNAAGGSIKSGNLKPGEKASCDQHNSREPRMAFNNNGKLLQK